MKSLFINKIKSIFYSGKSTRKTEEGSAIVIAVLVMLLLLAFVALAISRTTVETISVSNDASETRTFSAAQASLELMTRNFSKIFDEKLAPDQTDLNTKVIAPKPSDIEGADEFENYEFKQGIIQTDKPKQVTMTGGIYQGLNATRDEWELQATATEKSSGVQVELHRQFFNNLIPIFQFGIFYDDDLEVHPGARFDFGGRVHSNANLFSMTGSGTYFDSRVSAVGQIITDVSRSGKKSAGKWGELTYIKNASGKNVQLKYSNGSVTSDSTLAEGSKFFGDDMPVLYRNKDWKKEKEFFQGNLLAEQEPLDLPLKIASKIDGKALDYVEIIRRGKNKGDVYQKAGASSVTVVTDSDADTVITQKGRYYNKEGIRISLADSKQKLPGCAEATGDCGIRLDEGDGYLPLPMKKGSDIYQATRFNAARFRISGREIWIKVELVDFNEGANKTDTTDVTEQFLSLGITEQAPIGLIKDAPVTPTNKAAGDEQLLTAASPSSYDTSNTDSRSIIKLQRFALENPFTLNSSSNRVYVSFASNPAGKYITETTVNGRTYSIVNADERGKKYWQCKSGLLAGVLYSVLCAANPNNTSYFNLITPTTDKVDTDVLTDTDANIYYSYLSGSPAKVSRIAPFPIKMFDSREGLYNMDNANDYKIGSTNCSSGGNCNVPANGVMSMVDIDIANLKRFFDDEWKDWQVDGKAMIKSADVPQNKGWVLYISDRRGDVDFDGEYDMENVYTTDPLEVENTAAAFQKAAEDINKNNKLDTLYGTEAPRYKNTSTNTDFVLLPERAATVDHRYYRRGVRLINAEKLPGNYNAGDASKTRGFTVASENGVYVFGNYNAESVDSTGNPTSYDKYNPKGAEDVPASIAADAVTILSNEWQDSKSFRYPFDANQRKPTGDTYLRFAMLAGDATSSLAGTGIPNQGGDEPNMSGGVHNFKRFLEVWSGRNLFYSGSLINLFNAHNNNGTMKSSATVYNAPNRNWVFNKTFQDPNRLPPGTPYFQSIQLTGFQRVSD